MRQHPCDHGRSAGQPRTTSSDSGGLTRSARALRKESGRKAFWANLQELDGLLAGKQWTQGAQFTACDGYALVFYPWAARFELPVAELKNYTAFKDRMLERPAVRRVLEREKSTLLPAAA